MATQITARQFDIIEAAGKILTEKGVGGLTIKNLSAQMNFTESAIYRHFKSKEDIIASLLNFLKENIESRLESEILKYTEPQDKLKAIFSSQFDFFSQNKHFVVAVFSDGLLEENTRINKLIEEIINIKSNIIVKIIDEGQTKDVLNSKISSAELTNIILGTFRLLMFKWRLSNFSFDLNTQGIKTINSVFTLIKK